MTNHELPSEMSYHMSVLLVQILYLQENPYKYYVIKNHDFKTSTLLVDLGLNIRVTIDIHLFRLVSNHRIAGE